MRSRHSVAKHKTRSHLEGMCVWSGHSHVEGVTWRDHHILSRERVFDELCVCVIVSVECFHCWICSTIIL